MHRIDTPGSVNGEFVSGNPYGSPPTGGTVLDHRWPNTLQREVARVCEANGIVLDAANDGQLYDAIALMVLNGAPPMREFRAQARPNSTTLDLFGIALTTHGNLSPQQTANGPLVRCTTTNAAVTPEDVGFESTTYDLLQRRWNFDLTIEMRSLVVTHCRQWVAVCSATPMASGDPTALSLFGFRYDDLLEPGGTFKLCGSNGSAAPTVRDTGIVAVGGTDYTFRMRHTGGGHWDGFINGAFAASIDGSTAGGETAPATGTPLGLVSMLRHLSDAVVKSTELRLIAARLF